MVVCGDTDSLFIELHNIDLNALLKLMIEKRFLDTSNYAKTHPLYSTTLKAQLGCVKDESQGRRFKEWVLLRPKCYSMLFDDELPMEKKRAKGVQNYIVRQRLHHSHYKEVWEKSLIENVINRRIGSDKHQLYTFAVLKRALSSFEDKRAWLTCNKSLPYGHFSLPPINVPPPSNANDTTLVANVDMDVDDSPSILPSSSSSSEEEEDDNNAYTCEKCRKTFTTRAHLKRHVSTTICRL